MIYLDEHPHDLDLDAALEAVGAQRREQALRYRRDHDRRLCLAAHLLLQRALLKEYGIGHVPRFVFGEHGKPALEGLPGVHFNLSHCDEAVVCAVGDKPVGVDVESLKHYDDELARQVMSSDEQRLIASSSRPDVVFTRLWTMKESLLKLTGIGLTNDLPDLLNGCRHRFITWVGNGYVATVVHSSATNTLKELPLP